MNNEPIRPELVAARIAAAERLDDAKLADALEREPRLIELLWFIQWFSFQPGGLLKLAKDVLAAFADRVLSKPMKMAGAPGRDGQWTLPQALIAWKEEWQGAGHYRRASEGTADDRRLARNDPSLLEFLESVEMKTAPALECGFDDWLAFYFDPKLTAERVSRGIGCDKSNILRGLRRFNHAHFKSEALNSAAERLPAYLRDLCTLQHTSLESGPTWFPDIIAVLLDFMALHAAREKSKLAETEVSKMVFDTFDYSWGTKKLARITGDARFGKTESAKAYCATYPGRFRLVRVTGGNADSDLIRLVAESLGMELSFGRLRTETRQQVEDILRHGRIGIAFDECHYLFPYHFTRNSSPSRLNWVRGQIVDYGVPCVLIATPQAYKTQETRFRDTTGYNMEQFTGRIALDKPLPELLSQGDLMAVARYHFSNASQSVLDLLVGVAMDSPNYVGTINNLASRALWISQRRGAKAIALEDVRQAIGEVPGLSAEFSLEGNAKNGGTSAERQAKPARQRRKSPAEVVRELRPGSAETDFSASRVMPSRSEGLLQAPVLESV